MSNQNKNPFLYFWDLATGGLLSASPDKELTPNKRAGKTSKKSDTSNTKVSKPLKTQTPKKSKEETSNNLKLES